MVSDRPTGLLTQTQREFLVGEKEYEGEYAKQQRYQRRKAIEERIRHALLDFNILDSSLPDDFLKEAIIDDYDDDTPPEEMHHVLNALPSVFSVLYKGIRDTAADSLDGPIETYENFVEDGVTRAINQEGLAVKNVSVTIEVERGSSLEELRKKQNLSFGEANQLLQGGKISGEEFLELIDAEIEVRDDEE